MEESQLGPQNMDRLVDLLNSMRSNSSGVEKQLASFMEEAQSSAQSEESLAQVVGAIYAKAVSDRSFAATAAKLCDKMALFMVEGTKFRSLLLNALQVRAAFGIVCLPVLFLRNASFCNYHCRELLVRFARSESTSHCKIKSLLLFLQPLYLESRGILLVMVSI